MKVTCQINDYSDPVQIPIKVHNAFHGEQVELEVDGKRFVVDGRELISAVEKCMLDWWGR